LEKTLNFVTFSEFLTHPRVHHTFCKVIIVEALLSDNFVPFGKTDVLETLTYTVEQWWTVFRESEEVLGLKSCLIGCDVSGSPGGHAVYQAHGISKEHKV
jgi:hypothetical protein